MSAVLAEKTTTPRPCAYVGIASSSASTHVEVPSKEGLWIRQRLQINEIVMIPSPSNPSSSPSESLIHFEGDWPAEEKTLIRTAVLKTETEVTFLTPDGLKAPWIVTRKVLKTRTLYAASRHGLSGILKARSALTLAGHIVGIIRRSKGASRHSPSDPDR